MMSFWPIILILLAIALAVGPIMMMQPSSREKRIATLRQEAAQAGLRIRMAKNNKEDDIKPIAVYTYLAELPEGTQTWSLLRRSYEHEIHFHKTWEWQTATKGISSNKEEALFQFVDALSDDIVGLEVNENRVGIWWNEKPNTLTIGGVKQLLKELVSIVS